MRNARLIDVQGSRQPEDQRRIFRQPGDQRDPVDRQQASVEANITGDNIVIAGKVNGDILAHKMLTLMPTAVLHGNISTSKLNIVEGAIFQGQCQMTEGQEPATRPAIISWGSMKSRNTWRSI